MLDYVDYHAYRGETIHYHDERSKAEREEIEALLRTCKRSAVPVPFRGWFGDDYIHLTGGDGRRPLHILLSDGSGGGKSCYMLYTSAEKGGYPIRDGEKLMKALLAMLEE